MTYSENHLEKLFTQGRSKFNIKVSTHIIFRYPYPIDCEEVPEFLKDKYKNYESYLNSLGTFSYFVMGNGPN